MPIIEVDHITKEYRLGAMQGLRETLLNTAARLRGIQAVERPLFKAMDDVSFSIEQGEVVGIIGHNGAGKSTLLKMLARISTPTRGSVKVNGRIAPLIEVGAGFIPDFTGRENVYLNGSILGLSRNEIDKKFDEIVTFAEMEEFIDTPVKRYSSGMQVKLAFAVATSIDAEILIVDEVLAVGDLAFQRKCFDRMEEMIKRGGKTVLLVSHNIRQVERLCSRVIMLERGRVALDGNPQQVCNAFYEKSDDKIIAQSALSKTGAAIPIVATGELMLEQILILDCDGRETSRVAYGSTISIRATFKLEKEINGLAFGIGIHTPDLIYVANDDSSLQIGGNTRYENGILQVDYLLDKFILLPGVYALRVGVAQNDNDRALYYAENLCHFQVYSDSLLRTRTVSQGFVSLGGAWSIKSIDP